MGAHVERGEGDAFPGQTRGICSIKCTSSCHVLEQICLWSIYTTSHPPGKSIAVHKHLGSTCLHRETFPGRQVRASLTLPLLPGASLRQEPLSSDQAQERCFALGNSSCSQAEPMTICTFQGLRAWRLSMGEALEDKLRCLGGQTSPPGL